MQQSDVLDVHMTVGILTHAMWGACKHQIWGDWCCMIVKSFSVKSCAHAKFNKFCTLKMHKMGQSTNVNVLEPRMNEVTL